MVTKSKTSASKHTAALAANTAALDAHTQALIAHSVALRAATALMDNVVWRSAHCINGQRAIKTVDAAGTFHDGSEPCTSDDKIV